jgi:hypothetical protein
MFISILLGLGLATLFRKVCKDKECIDFHGPVIHEIDGKIFQYGDECYKFKQRASSKCDNTKKIVTISAVSENPDGTPNIAANAGKVKYLEKASEADAAEAAATSAATSDGVFGIGKIFTFLNGRSGGNSGVAAQSAALSAAPATSSFSSAA